jgi:hypothetical protein
LIVAGCGLRVKTTIIRPATHNERRITHNLPPEFPMTRSTRGDQIVVQPKNDVYTALAAAACVALILGLVALFTGASDKFGDGLLMPNGGTGPTATR